MSNFEVNDKGQRVIPATRRPDGTWRKEIVVRGGYVAQDEVATYISRASKPKTIPGLPPSSQTPAPQEVSKKKRNRNKKSSSETDGVEALNDSVEALKLSPQDTISPELLASPSCSSSQPSASTNVVEEVIDPSKKLKAVKKKLREILELQKKASEGVQLSEDQQVKLARLPEIQEEIAKLELEVVG